MCYSDDTEIGPVWLFLDQWFLILGGAKDTLSQKTAHIHIHPGVVGAVMSGSDPPLEIEA